MKFQTYDGVLVVKTRIKLSLLPTIEEENEKELEEIAQIEAGIAKRFQSMTYSRILEERLDEVSELIDWWIVTNRRKPGATVKQVESNETESPDIEDNRKDSFNFVGKWKRKEDGKWKRFKLFVSKRIFGNKAK